MCCIIEKSSTEYFKDTHVSTIKGYKILKITGKGLHTNFQYGPGKFQLDKPITAGEYDITQPQGFHFYTRQHDAIYETTLLNYISTGHILLEVEVDIDDIIGVSESYRPFQEGVANAITITQESWDKAFGKGEDNEPE